jgi:hypothetical protein
MTELQPGVDTSFFPPLFTADAVENATTHEVEISGHKVTNAVERGVELS